MKDKSKAILKTLKFNTMKTIKILFICMLAFTFVKAQDVPPYSLSEQEVTPPKFEAQKIHQEVPKHSINHYVATHFEYPEVIGLAHEGTEVVQFTVNTSGDLSGFKVLNSVTPEIDRETIRVLKSTNNMWTPAKNNGISVASTQEIAIAIKTGETEEFAKRTNFNDIAKVYYLKGAKQLLVKHKPKKALHNFDAAIRYQPYDRSLLMMRAFCKMDLGKMEAAKDDLARINKLGGVETAFGSLTENQQSLQLQEYLTDLLAIQ